MFVTLSHFAEKFINFSLKLLHHTAVVSSAFKLADEERIKTLFLFCPLCSDSDTPNNKIITSPFDMTGSNDDFCAIKHPAQLHWGLDFLTYWRDLRK